MIHDRLDLSTRFAHGILSLSATSTRSFKHCTSVTRSVNSSPSFRTNQIQQQTSCKYLHQHQVRPRLKRRTRKRRRRKRVRVTMQMSMGTQRHQGRPFQLHRRRYSRRCVHSSFTYPGTASTEGQSHQRRLWRNSGWRMNCSGQRCIRMRTNF